MKQNNEFKKIVDEIDEKYEMTHREMAAKLNITEVSFSRYYEGTRGATEEEMSNLRKLSEDEKFTVVKTKYNKFKYLVDVLITKHKISKKEIMIELMIDDMTFISYYDGDKDASNELLNKLSKFEKEIEEKEQEDNEFRKTVKEIEQKCFMTRREMAKRIGITEVSFFRFYDGAKEPTVEAMNNLKELNKNQKFDATKIEKNDISKVAGGLYDKYKKEEEKAIETINKIMKKSEVEKTNMDNEFKELVDKLYADHKMIRREVATKLNITDVNFHLYYEGFKIPEQDIIDNLKNLIKIKNNEGEPDIIEELNKRHYVNQKNQYEFAEIIHRLSKLNNEHKKEIYDLINSYSEDERNTKKLTPDNKD